jgi:hypothetical protein
MPGCLKSSTMASIASDPAFPVSTLPERPCVGSKTAKGQVENQGYAPEAENQGSGVAWGNKPA